MTDGPPVDDAVPDDVSAQVFDETERVPSPEHVTGECWEWTGTSTCGHGVVHVDGKTVGVHRVAAKAEVDGSIDIHPGDNHSQNANHRCGNGLCVNPDHLYVGTQEENMADLAAEHGGRTAFDDADTIVEIRETYAETDASTVDIAGEYGVNSATIARIVRGDSYRHAGGPTMD